MPAFFIEMGQGIIAPKSNLFVRTSTLLSCTYIAGINPKTKRAGAFHYPSNALNGDSPKTVKALTAWFEDLSPSAVRIVHASSTDGIFGMGMSMGTSDVDKKMIKTFLINHAEMCSIEYSTSLKVVAGTVSLKNFILSDSTIGAAIGGELDVSNKRVDGVDYFGENGGYMLYGENEN